MQSPASLRRTAAVACLSAVLLLGCAAETPEALVTSAKDYLAKNDAKAAVIQLKNALQKDPDLAEARFLLGKSLLASGDVLAAEKELRKALELKYPSAEVNPPLAQTMIAMGEYQKVVDQFGGAEASTAPGKAELRTALGQAHLAMGKSDAARQAFADARAADPSYAPAVLGEARLAALGGDLPGALKSTESAIALAPSAPEAWQLKGDILSAEREGDAAVAAYQKAVALKQDYLPAHAALVSLLLQQGKQDAAVKALAEMKQVAPKHPQTFYLEALVRVQEKNWTAARDAVEEQLRILPDNLPGLLLGATIDHQLHSYAPAERKLLTVLQRVPNQPLARRTLVSIYVQTGQTAKALDALKPLLSTADKDPAVLNMAGEIYLRKGEPAVAATYFQKAALLEPAGSRQLTGLALTRLAQGDAERGIKELETAAAADQGIRADLMLITTSLQRRQFDKALAAIDALEKKQPGKPLAHNLRGVALLGKKDAGGARKSFERALTVDPNFFPATMNLARLDIAEKKPGDAEQRFKGLIANNPGNTDALLALAALRARNKGPSDEAAGLIEKAVSAKPSAVAPRLALVRHYLRMRDAKKAVAAGQDALTAIPGRPELLEVLGQAQQAAGDHNQALVTYNRLVEAAPNSPTPWLRVSEAQAASKDYEGAAQSLRKALAMKPDLIDAQRRLIALDLTTDRAPQALAVAREVQKQRPKEPVGYVLEGDIHASKKAWAEAVAAYRTGSKQTGPGAGESGMKLHAALNAAGQNAEADKAAAAWLKDHPDDDKYRLYLAEAAGRRGDFATSLKHYEALLQKQPNNAVLMNNFAWTAGKLKDPRALEYAEKANKVAPNQPAIMDTLGTLLVEKGDAVRGVELLRKATELAPASANVRLNLAKALINTGQKDAAKKELDELAKLGDKYAGQEEVARLAKSL